MKRLFAPLILIAALAAIVPKIASAHVLKTDGSIGAVMHIDPDDDPIVSEPATFFFEIKDKQNKFTPEQCDCSANILRDGKTIFSAALFKDSSNNTINYPTFSYTFPERAVYTVQVVGKPLSDGAFQPFTLNYDVRVSRVPATGAAAPSSAAPNHTIHYIIFGAGFLIFFLLLFRDRYKNKSGKNFRLHAVAFILLFGLALHHTHVVQALCHPQSDTAQEHQCCFAPATALAPAVTTALPIVDRAIISPTINHVSLSIKIVLNNKSPPSASELL
jgi:hypothetical protein